MLDVLDNKTQFPKDKAKTLINDPRINVAIPSIQK